MYEGELGSGSGFMFRVAGLQARRLVLTARLLECSHAPARPLLLPLLPRLLLLPSPLLQPPLLQHALAHVGRSRAQPRAAGRRGTAPVRQWAAPPPPLPCPAACTV